MGIVINLYGWKWLEDIDFVKFLKYLIIKWDIFFG